MKKSFCSSKIEFLVDKVTNITQNRILFSLLLVFIAYMIALKSHAMYMASDDYDMRIIIEGSALGLNFPPSEFSLYMNILYGKFLKFFYNIYKNWFWYDLFTYIFVGCSFFVINLFVFENLACDTFIVKLIKFIILISVFSICFVIPQFTITSGLLSVSGIFSFYMLFCSNSKNKSNIALSLYCIFSLLFSSLIRFECCALISFFSLLILIPFFPKRNLKSFIKKGLILFSSLILIIFCLFLDNQLRSENINWDKMTRANIARGELTEKMFIWDDIDNGNIFQRTIQTFLNTPDSTEYMNDFDYKLLISSFFLTNTLMSNVDNLEYISSRISHKLQKEKRVSLDLKNYYGFLKYFVILFLCISVYSNGLYKTIYIFSIFLLTVVIVNYFFKTMPERLWFNLFFPTIVISLYGLRNSFFSYCFCKNMFFTLFLVILIFFSSYNIFTKSLYVTETKYNAFVHIRNDINKVPNCYFYISDFVLMEQVSAPFRKNILKNILCLNPHIMDESYRHILKMYNLDTNKNDPWFNVCKSDSIIRILYHDYEYPVWYIAIKDAISYYMKRKYNLTVVSTGEHINGFWIIRFRALSKKESDLRKKYFEQLGSIHNSISTYDPIKFEFVRKFWGYNLSYLELVDAIDIINGEVLYE